LSSKPLTQKINESLAKKQTKANSVPVTTEKKIKKKKAIAGTTSSLRKFKKNQIKQNIELKEKERYIEEVSINPLSKFQ